MKNSCFILLLIFCFSACQTARKGGDDFFGDKISLQKTDLLISDTSLLGKYEVIPFELNTNSTIKQVDKILLFEDKIGVVDLALRTLLIFDREGSFLYEVNHVGGGPGEYGRLLDVSLDPIDSCFAVLTDRNAIMFYSYTGEFKYSIKKEEAAHRMALKGDYIYLLFPDRVNYDKQEYSLMALNRRNGEKTILLEQGIRPVESLWTNGYLLITGKDAVYFMQRYTHRLYKVVGENFTPLYELDLGKFELPDLLMEEGIDKQFFIKECSASWSVFSLINFCELPDGFMLCSNLPGFFYYDLKKKELDHMDGIRSQEYGVDFYSSIPVEPVGESVALILDEYRITSMKEHRRESERPALKALLDHLPMDSNPVLFLYSLKK